MLSRKINDLCVLAFWIILSQRKHFKTGERSCLQFSTGLLQKTIHVKHSIVAGFRLLKTKQEKNSQQMFFEIRISDGVEVSHFHSI